MLRQLTALTALSILIAAASSPARAPEAKGKKHALLIGVNVYKNKNLPPLEYAENDVEEME